MHSVHPTPKFSIITVTYNAEKVLEDTIQSVISQTYHHVEYIIVDGASKDGTLSIMTSSLVGSEMCIRDRSSTDTAHG